MQVEGDQKTAGKAARTPLTSPNALIDSFAVSRPVRRSGRAPRSGLGWIVLRSQAALEWAMWKRSRRVGGSYS